MPLLLITEGGDHHPINAVVDTGFNGSLTLPPDLIASLGLPWEARTVGELADGTLIENNAYAATILWNGQPRPVLATQIEGTPLIGMKLLTGHELRIQAIEGGDVTIVSLD